MDCTAIILTIGIIFAASFFSTVSGFGFALVAMPVLTLVMSVKAAVVFVLLLNLVLRAITMYRVREGYDKATVILTTLGSVVGMIKLGTEGTACGTAGSVFGSSACGRHGFVEPAVYAADKK